jgi:hypothetical protein
LGVAAVAVRERQDAGPFGPCDARPLSYHETRGIKPEYKEEIEKMIRKGTTTTGKVDIT